RRSPLATLFPYTTLFRSLELEQGLGLGLFGGIGILLQVDGMACTSASTSAFLTQCYCLWIPAWVAWREKSLPPVKVFLSCVLVIDRKSTRLNSSHQIISY